MILGSDDSGKEDVLKRVCRATTQARIFRGCVGFAADPTPESKGRLCGLTVPHADSAAKLARGLDDVLLAAAARQRPGTVVVLDNPSGRLDGDATLRPAPRKSATRWRRPVQERANPPSPRPEPAQSLRGRVVVDAEVLRDPADAGAAVVHRGSLRRDRLVKRRLKVLEELSLKRNLGDGAKALRTRPRAGHRSPACVRSWEEPAPRGGSPPGLNSGRNKPMRRRQTRESPVIRSAMMASSSGWLFGRPRCARSPHPHRFPLPLIDRLDIGRLALLDPDPAFVARGEPCDQLAYLLDVGRDRGDRDTRLFRVRLGRRRPDRAAARPEDLHQCTSRGSPRAGSSPPLQRA